MEKGDIVKNYAIIEADALVAQQQSALLPQRDDGVAPFPAHHFLCSKKDCLFTPERVRYSQDERASYRQQRENPRNQALAGLGDYFLRASGRNGSANYRRDQREVKGTREKVWSEASACELPRSYAVIFIEGGIYGK